MRPCGPSLNIMEVSGVAGGSSPDFKNPLPHAGSYFAPDAGSIEPYPPIPGC